MKKEKQHDRGVGDEAENAGPDSLGWQEGGECYRPEKHQDKWLNERLE
jgi:hypothetical protein